MKLIATLLPIVTLALAVPADRRQQQCSNPSVRMEWRSLEQDQRDQFHQAIKCLQTKPSNEGSQSLFDRYSSLHVDMFDDSALPSFPYDQELTASHGHFLVHYVAAFAPWHRYFLQAREVGLRECGYTGPIP